MTLEEMTKKELIEYIHWLQKQRAYSYEDRMKLAILDESPFTIWASDRNCRITLWSGKCESLYGYTKNQALGQDYVNLFVAEDERVAARADQISIIDEGAIFHNIANDIGRSGNTLRLITNCFRIRDVDSGEYWNAEMGIIVDYYEQEKERLKRIVAESRKIKSCINWFKENGQQCKMLFLERKKSLISAIQQCEKKAIELGKRGEFRSKRQKISEHLNGLGRRVEDIIDKTYTGLQECTSYEQCEEARQVFIKKHSEILIDLEDIVLDVQEISCCYDNDSSIVSNKDAIMKDSATRSRNLSDQILLLLMSMDAEIDEYKALQVESDSSRLKELTDRRDAVLACKKRMVEMTDSIYTRTVSAINCEQLIIIKSEMEGEYKMIEEKLLELKGGSE